MFAEVVATLEVLAPTAQDAGCWAVKTQNSKKAPTERVVVFMSLCGSV